MEEGPINVVKVEKPTIKRKKAIFSCDRCKTRKRKCVRYITNENGEKTPSFDIIYPCEECIQSKSICHTYLGQRRQTTLKKLSLTESAISEESMSQNSDAKAKELEVKCQYLINLLKQIFPDIKTELFQEDETSPLSVGSTCSSDQSSIALSSNRNSFVKQEEEEDMEEMKNFARIAEEGILRRKDYIGPLGSSTLHDTVIELIGSPGSLKSSSPGFAHTITPEHNLFTNDMQAKFYDNNQLIYSIPRPEADHYVCDFFDRIHPICNCIDKEEFVQIYEVFWLLLKYENLRSINSNLFVSSPQICTIYLIWILGKRFKHNNDKSLSEIYFQIIQNTLSEMILRPSEAGVQMAILFSLYLESTHSKKSAWIVIEAAVTQAIAIGMNKNKKGNLANIDEKTNKHSKIWCTLFAQEVRLSSIMGRQSSIDFMEANITPPKFQPVKHSNLPRYWVYQINHDDYQLYFDRFYELNKLFYDFLRYRSSIMESTSVYTISSIKKAWDLRSKFHRWINSLPPTLKNIFAKTSTGVYRYRVFLHLTYHYYFVNLGLPFLMLILRIMQSQKMIKLKKTDPIYVLAISAISCSKQIFNIIDFEYENEILNGSIYNDIYVLYHSTLIFAIAIAVISNKQAEMILDLEHLEQKENISKEKLRIIISKIGQLNKKLQPLTSGSNFEDSQNIQQLVDSVSRFLSYEGTSENDKTQPKDQSALQTSSPRSFDHNLNNLFHTMNLDTNEVWKMMNWDRNSYEGEAAFFEELLEFNNSKRVDD